MGLTLNTAPTEEPVTLDELRLWARLDETEENSELENSGIAAREYLEAAMNRQFVTATWEWTIDQFDTELRVPRPPLSSITKIEYYDTAGVEQTLSSAVYRVIGAGSESRGRVVLALNQDWPDIMEGEEVITVTFVAGYGAATAVPQSIKTAIKRLAIHLFENRGTAPKDAVSSLPEIDRLIWTQRIVPV